MKKYAALLFVIFGFQSSQGLSRSVQELDLLNTCVTPQQRAMAGRVLLFWDNYKSWKVRDLYRAIHPQYASWHSSRSFQAVMTPIEKRATLPFGNGQYYRDGFVENLAKIAYRYDTRRYNIDIKRIECLGQDTLIASTVFNGTSVIRDASGKAMWEVPVVNLPTRFTVIEANKLIYRYILDTDDNVTIELGKKFEVVTKGPPNARPDIEVLTLAQILEFFQKQIR